MRSRLKNLPGRLPLLAAAFVCQFSSPWAYAGEAVECHYTYGGETRTLRAPATTTPYLVAPEQIGSYFLLRVVFETPPAPLPAIKIYTYANLDAGPLPIHVAEFPYPPSSQARAPGFTGYQRVYEPVRDGELQYWCALNKHSPA